MKKSCLAMLKVAKVGYAIMMAGAVGAVGCALMIRFGKLV